jgi:hypothetical protein
MGIDSHYGDPDVQEQGRWFPVEDEETELLIRHASNEDYVQCLVDNLSDDAAEALSVFRSGDGAIQTERTPDIDDDTVDEINDVMLEAAAKHLLVDWKNLSVDDPELASEFDKEPGQNIGYTSERAEQLFDLIPGLYNEVREIAKDEAKFRRNTNEADKKN